MMSVCMVFWQLTPSYRPSVETKKHPLLCTADFNRSYIGKVRNIGGQNTCTLSIFSGHLCIFHQWSEYIQYTIYVLRVFWLPYVTIMGGLLDNWLTLLKIKV
jgi:hypothetical protein